MVKKNGKDFNSMKIENYKMREKKNKYTSIYRKKKERTRFCIACISCILCRNSIPSIRRNTFSFNFGRCCLKTFIYTLIVNKCIFFFFIIEQMRHSLSSFKKKKRLYAQAGISSGQIIWRLNACYAIRQLSERREEKKKKTT